MHCAPSFISCDPTRGPVCSHQPVLWCHASGVMLVVSNEWTAVPLTSPEEISKGFVNKSLRSSRSSAKQSHINTTCRGDGPQENAGVSFNPHPSSLVQSPNSPFFPSHVGAEPGRAKKMIFFPLFGGKKSRSSEHAHASYSGLFFSPVWVQPLYGAGRKES